MKHDECIIYIYIVSNLNYAYHESSHKATANGRI